jgi:hypothetical protein
MVRVSCVATLDLWRVVMMDQVFHCEFTHACIGVCYSIQVVRTNVHGHFCESV